MTAYRDHIAFLVEMTGQIGKVIILVTFQNVSVLYDELLGICPVSNVYGHGKREWRNMGLHCCSGKKNRGS